MLGVTGGLLVAAVPWLPIGRWPALLLVVIGTVPFAALTWTGLVPLVVAALATGLTTRVARRPAGRGAPGPRTPVAELAAPAPAPPTEPPSQPSTAMSQGSPGRS